MRRITGHLIMSLAVLTFFSGGETQADILSFSFTDPVGDHNGIVDLVSVTVTFDNTTGDYEVLLTADAANPFNGNFRINLNLFNPDTGTTAPDPSFFQDTFNDFNLASSTMTMTLVGTNSRLLAWEAGDRVATSDIPFGNPDGSTMFRSAVGDLPLGGYMEDEDTIAYGDSTTIVSTNTSPTADAGYDKYASFGNNVLLEGSGSDAEDLPGELAFQWTQIAGTGIVLTGADTATASFTAPESVGSLTFRLTVTDTEGATATDTVMVTVFCLPEMENSKKMSKYSSKEVFLISDENWRDVLRLVPLTTWTDDGVIHKYPTLIYHYYRDNYGGDNFDADSTIHFIQQYAPTRLTIFGETPVDLDNLLVTDGELGSPNIAQSKMQANPNMFIGAGLVYTLPAYPILNQIRKLNMTEYYSFWQERNVFVISKDDYETGLVASVFASYINAPLLFEGHFDYDIINSKHVYTVGLETEVLSTIGSRANIVESFSLTQLREKYIELTGTDKVILVNSNDLNIWLNVCLFPERGGGLICETFRGISLAAPFLAGARNEIIISVDNEALPDNPTCTQVAELVFNFLDVSQFVEDEVNSLFTTTPNPNYLTIVAAPKAIVDSVYSGDCYAGSHIRIACDWRYGSTDGLNPMMKVGRIYGVTISDASSYIARELFYSEIFDDIYASDEFTGLVIGHSFTRYYDNMQHIKQDTTASDYETNCFTGADRTDCVTEEKPGFENYSRRQFIVYGDHGGPDEWTSTMSFNEIPWLDVPYIFAHACLTNDFWEELGRRRVFGANLLRKGAVCYYGATGVSTGDNSETKALERMTGVSRYNIGELNNWLIENFPVYKKDYMMLGDPLFEPVFKEVDWDLEYWD